LDYHEFETPTLIDIKRKVNKFYPEYLVLMNVGPYWFAVEDDAVFFHENYDYSLHPNVGHDRVSVSIKFGYVIRRYCREQLRACAFVCELEDSRRAYDDGPIRMLRSAFDATNRRVYSSEVIHDDLQFRDYTYGLAGDGESKVPFEEFTE